MATRFYRREYRRPYRETPGTLYVGLVRARAQPPFALPAPFLRHPRARRGGETRRRR